MRLAALKAQSIPPTLPELIEAFIASILSIRGSPRGRAFIRLQVRLNLETGRAALKMWRESYDSSTHAYVQEFRRCVPHLTEAAAYIPFVPMVGAYLYAVSDTNWLNELLKISADKADLMAETVAFVIGGFEAVAASMRSTRHGRGRSGAPGLLKLRLHGRRVVLIDPVGAQAGSLRVDDAAEWDRPRRRAA